MKALLASLCILSSTIVFAQKADSLVSAVDTLVEVSKVDSAVVIVEEGSLEVFSDSRLDDLIDKHVMQNKKDCPDLVKGYRVQIYSTAGSGAMERAKDYKIKFLSAYPELKTYVDFEAPSWKVRIGDCRTKYEAEKIKKLIQVDFPHCFVVPDHIATPFLKECEDIPEDARPMKKEKLKD